MEKTHVKYNIETEHGRECVVEREGQLWRVVTRLAAAPARGRPVLVSIRIDFNDEPPELTLRYVNVPAALCAREPARALAMLPEILTALEEAA